MKNTKIAMAGATVLGLSLSLYASPVVPERTPALAETTVLAELGIEALRSDVATGLSYVELKPHQKAALSYYMHARGRCGGFQALPQTLDEPAFKIALSPLKEAEMLRSSLALRQLSTDIEPRPELREAFDEVSAENQRKWVDLLSSYESRYHNTSDPNKHVRDIQARLEDLAKASKLPIRIDLISHERTPQKSIRARIEGSKRPHEIVVIGGHLDSTVGWFSRGRAPGADDNASGSANVLEAFRILSKMPQPERSIEFFWYAAEEIGLVGSAEIARSYKAQQKDIIGALQLDMTLHPGDGPLTLASMTDYTSPWLRQLLVDINNAYALGARILSDKCGYGCSDHASWYQQGYATLMPFEASFAKMNSEIHTVRDVVNSRSNFHHSALFTKIALAFAWELGNSSLREPKP